MNSISFPVHSAYTDYGKFASGKKIQNASDGAAESAIIQKQEEQIRGYEAGKKNISAMKSLTNVMDAAQSGVNDYLQRMNELAVRAGNSFMSQSDKAGIQQELDMLKDGISQISSTANFNEKKLLDGSNPSFSAAAGSGTMASITTSNSTLEALGLGDFSITGKNNAKQITGALTKISQLRTQSQTEEAAQEEKKKAAADVSARQANPLEDSETMASIATSNSALSAVGMGDFSITGQYNSKQITEALSDISQKRTQSHVDKAQEQRETEEETRAAASRENVLEGSNPSFNMEKGSGAMASIATSNSALETLGFGEFSITGKYNSRQITDALNEVSRQRAKTGAQANGLEYAYRSQANASYNTTAAQSRIGDLDYPKAISDQRKKEVLQEYSNFVMRANMRIQGEKMIFFE